MTVFVIHPRTEHHNRFDAILLQRNFKQILNNQILNCSDHPLFGEFALLPLGRHFRLPLLRTRRARDSFIPVAIRNLNLGDIL